MRATTVGIISIGDMGLGIAKLLQSHGFRVVTVTQGRSEHTLTRIRAAAIEAFPSVHELVVQADYILSIVPPRNAFATAERVAEACRQPETQSQRELLEDVNGQPSRSPLYFLELNATPARSAEEAATLFQTQTQDQDQAPRRFVPNIFLDGGIIGAPPTQRPDGSWKRPSVVVSGTVENSTPATFTELAKALNIKVVSERIGAASTLKLTFAALTKGLTALSILSFSTAEREAVLPELLAHLEEYSPATAGLARSGVVGMSPKAYRWEEEMRGIGETLDREGGWEGVGERVYGGIAEIYRTVAEETILGQERVGQRERGTSVEDAAQIIARRKD
ncbi:Dehydrogenase multihelical [Penicillium waksmanii]|uniref:Dehydrogenase multihelical n=1 Tax=Penicillium waksmanii TaxID=69791 RepID=UPI002549288F|nr:Dehydrogenase multihelical [Penicillium waksmanii]KAJ5988705.1 Dehydrogenase multihelical [Penicillium waksmanii]